MTWKRRNRESDAWVQRFTWHRDGGECQLRLPGCTGDAEELHHIIGVAESGGRQHADNSLDNLAWECHDCKSLKDIFDASPAAALEQASDS